MTSLLSPALVLSVVLSTACAAFFHLWHRGDMAALRRYLVIAWLGFVTGQLLGDLTGVQWLRVGHLSVLNGTIGATAALLIAKSLET
jgi:hypothetical protein